MRALRLFAALSLVIGSFAFATPVAAGDPCYHGFDEPPLSEGTDPQVKMMPCAFAPTVVRVAAGTTVEWFSGPGFVHLLTGANQEWGSRDEEVQPESVVAYRFDKPGTYPYACALHRGMSGAIVVGDGDGDGVAVAGATGSATVAVVRVTPKDAPAATSAAAAASATAAPTVAAAAGGQPASASNPAPAADRLPLGPLAIVGGVGVLVAVLVGWFAAGGRRRPELPIQR